MTRLLAFGAICTLLLPIHAAVATPHEPPRQQGGVDWPIIQDPPTDERDYPAYCDQVVTDAGIYRLQRECYVWLKYSGFDVAVHRKVLRDYDVGFVGMTIDALRSDLFALSRQVPAAALEKMRGTMLIVTETGPCAGDWIGCYQSSQDIYWVRMLPNSRGLTYTSQWPTNNNVLMHELAHAYHAQWIPDGYENQCIKDLYQQTLDAGMYDDVAFHHASNAATEDWSTYELWHGEHYGISNHREFFAEFSAAYFIGSNYEPYNRSMLLETDYPLARAIH